MATAATADAHSVAVAVNGGTVLGRRQPASEDYPRALDIFYGVPYAAAERFRRAVAVPPVRRGETLDARDEGRGEGTPCPGGEGRVEESPLRLNIFRPAAFDGASGSSVAAGAAAGAAGVGVERDGGGDGAAEDETKKKNKPRRRLLPVLVYIHGGGFNFGSPLERDLGAMVAWAPRGVLVVSVSYRLGALGFLGGGGDGGGGDGDAAVELNLGLRDQRLAVRWVADWIGAFGGQGREGVTLMGVSAGAHSIGHHMLSPAPLPSHHRSILESGSPTARSVLSARHARPAAQLASLKRHAVAAAAGRRRQQRAVAAKEVVDLSTLPLDDLLGAAVTVFGENMASVCWPFQPVVEDTDISRRRPNSTKRDSGDDDNDDDDAIIPDTPLRLWDRLLLVRPDSPSPSRDARRKPPGPIITGFCSHEGTPFVPTRAATNDAFLSFFTTLIPGLTADDLAALQRLYPDPVGASPSSSSPSSSLSKLYANPPGCPHAAQYTRLQAAYAHYAYICPVLHTARAASLSASRGGGPVYLYEFAALAGDDPSSAAAASHGDSSAVVAHDPAHLRSRPGLRAVADAMNARWMAFAASPDGLFDSSAADTEEEGGKGDEGKEEEDDEVKGLAWPRFESPFDVVDRASGRRGSGRLLVFGEGNDEAAGGRARGTPVRVRTLTEREMEQCRFWWDRMALSQGMGERERNGM
ncbi:phenmedipham hydrolase [Purpureocillium lilacinum]|uniref:Phenmedipham hydrolase n=1 Tax=Purpureocillium lilacinum TaxID=33203 RepID=A0A179HFP1_PURLI|nr:phenmedipham hydrolase [Purpureocillium lilacinum]OAQ88772.1 phenmedipham hydrolase [Purpureocillium lilacinum]